MLPGTSSEGSESITGAELGEEMMLALSEGLVSSWNDAADSGWVSDAGECTCTSSGASGKLSLCCPCAEVSAVLGCSRGSFESASLFRQSLHELI